MYPPCFQVIKRIYELAWEQFSDLPRGHHKVRTYLIKIDFFLQIHICFIVPFQNNSMHKLASKTMIEILPDHLLKHIETKCGSLANTPGE